jgi:hypothetical protein
MKRFVVTLATLANGLAFGQQNVVPSCYTANKIEVAAPSAARHVFVMVDETTLFDDRLKAVAWSSIEPLVVGGTHLTVVRFSAYAQQRYTTTSFSGLVEATIPDRARGSISVRKLKTFDECLKGQQGFVLKKLEGALSEAFTNASSDLRRSDVMAAFNDMANAVRTSASKDRIVVVMSDMLENSSVSSFYATRGIRKVDPAAELEKATKTGMVGDFGGARVWVIGAGLLAADSTERKGVYRDPVTMQELKRFWTQYFEKSKASLVEFGAPELKQQIE